MAESGKAGGRTSFRQRGGLWVLAQFALMGAVVVLAWRFRGQILGAWSVWLGGILFVLGGGIGVAGVMALGHRTTPFPKPTEATRLVRTGIYARMRHPLYTSVMLLALGWALLWQSGSSALAALALIPFFRAKAKREERWLRAAYAEYAEYEAVVPRFIPRGWGRLR
jgi:protein-S-isoprenylcysteine O-methyltransferase Ste14